MTTTTTPDEIHPALPDDALACGFCGAAVQHPSADGTFTVTPMAVLRGSAIAPFRGEDITFATCDSCAERHAEAQRILEAHPTLRRRFGADNAQHRLSGALDGCAALGVQPPKNLTENRELTLHLMRVMAVPGVDARWLRLYAPVTGEVGSGRSAATPWAQATAEDREELRRSFASVLAYRVAQDSPDRQIMCPDGGGCLLCGVVAVSLPATRVVALGGVEGAARRVWAPRVAALASIGGKSGRAQVEGYLCPACDEAVSHVGSVGPTAMVRSLSKHLRARGATESAGELEFAAREDSISGLVGHAVVGGEGTLEPWEHVQLGGGQ